MARTRPTWNIFSVRRSNGVRFGIRRNNGSGFMVALLWLSLSTKLRTKGVPADADVPIQQFKLWSIGGMLARRV